MQREFFRRLSVAGEAFWRMQFTRIAFLPSVMAVVGLVSGLVPGTTRAGLLAAFPFVISTGIRTRDFSPALIGLL